MSKRIDPSDEHYTRCVCGHFLADHGPEILGPCNAETPPLADGATSCDCGAFTAPYELEAL